MITAERLRELVHYEPLTGLFTRRVQTGPVHAGDLAGGLDHRYVRISVDGKRYYAQHLAWLYVHGVWPSDDLDHVDEDKTNNRISNLRQATRVQNAQNLSHSHRDNISGYLGVSQDKNKWEARISIDGKQQRLGRFDTPEEASEAYLAAKIIHHPFWAQEGKK